MSVPPLKGDFDEAAKNKSPGQGRIVSGIAVFCVLLPALPFGSAHLWMILTGRNYLPPIYNSTLAIVVVVTVVFAYVTARLVYFLLRWRRNPNREHDRHVPE